jgi:hypothetical protein
MGNETEPGWVKCHSSKLLVGSRGVPLEKCKVCYCRDHSPVKGVVLPQAKLPCKHLGQEKRRQKCTTCAGNVELKVLNCAEHGECTLGKKIDGVACCAGCSEYKPDTFRLVAPIGTRAGTTRRKPSWSYKSTCILPHLGQTDHLPLVLDLLRMQTEPPYIVIVDTGSTWDVCEKLELLRAEDVEIHYVRGGDYTNSSEPVCVALDLGFARTNTELIHLQHTDVFPMRRDSLEWLGAQCNEDTPVVGWEMSERSWITDKWKGVVSHTFTMLHAETMRRIGATWHMQRGRDVLGINTYQADGYPDTETGFDLCLKAAGIVPKLHGPEYNYQRQTTEWWDHCRSLTGLRVYGVGTELGQRAELYAAEGIKDAEARVRQWRGL